MLAAAVEEVLRTPLRPIAPRLRTAFELIELDYGERPTKEELKAAAEQSSYRGRWARRLLKKAEEGKAFDKSYPSYPVQAWKLGQEQLWISLGGEVVRRGPGCHPGIEA